MFDFYFSKLQFAIYYINFQLSEFNLLLKKPLGIAFQSLTSLFFGSNISFNTSNNGGKIRALFVNKVALFFKVLHAFGFSFKL